jgi:hypothetical protein
MSIRQIITINDTFSAHLLPKSSGLIHINPFWVAPMAMRNDTWGKKNGQSDMTLHGQQNNRQHSKGTLLTILNFCVGHAPSQFLEFVSERLVVEKHIGVIELVVESCF